jgi:hypothetical protein
MIPLRVQVPAGLTLRDAEGKTYQGGEPFDAPRDQFWLRRIADGSVQEIKADPAKSKTEPKRKRA